MQVTLDKRNAFAAFLLFMSVFTKVYASDTPDPTAVTIAGSFQQELGSPGDWQPESSLTQLSYDQSADLWYKTFNIPAGSWEYKAALNLSWDENYGENAQPFGANISLILDVDTDVTFFYDHKTHWVTDSVNSVVATLPGNYQEYLGASGNWQPEFLGTWLQDPDGDGIYTFITSSLPKGSYEVKVAINRSWSENYGEGGVPGGSNIAFIVPENYAEVFFSYNAETHILKIEDGAPKGDLKKSYSHWLDAETLVWNIPFESGHQIFMHYSYDGELILDTQGITGGSVLQLHYDPNGLDSELAQRFPHLSQLSVFKLDAAHQSLVPEILDGQFALSLLDENNNLIDATSIQIPGVLDDLYFYEGPLGTNFTNDIPNITLWAPTAQQVQLYLYDDADLSSGPSVLQMIEDSEAGTWSITGETSWYGKYYQYAVTVYLPFTGKVETNLVTDPYSLSLSMNSLRTQIISLDDPDLYPEGWENIEKPTLDRPEDIVLYELHIRDFSILDETVPENYRGTYKAFTLKNSDGMNHLSLLSQSGLTHVHLLPTFDIATVNEDRASHHQYDYLYLESLPSSSSEQQEIINENKMNDGFNWGYDPFHYTVPEGSYASSIEGSNRILEFREMVKALNERGLRVVMDVVYNHTNASENNEKSVFDKIVPGYYHRLNSSGSVENSTCCSNTASEHLMMERLMIDSLLTWAREYKIDGFRFDLMGHHMKSNMLAVQETLSGLTLEEDGIDGSSIYLYGEGWNFGEVANNAQGINATQLNMAGTGIATFNDRLRDAVRGGSPVHEDTIQSQGFANGLYYDSNGTEQGDELEKLQLLGDQIRVGLAGNLADFTFIDRNNNLVRGSEVDYNGSPAGYAVYPSETINYVEAHDDRTFFDATQLKVPTDLSLASRVRIQNLGLSFVALGQGIPFFHAGQELLRSKSMDRDSYDSGDWFNRLDLTYEHNNWGIGLPMEDKNGGFWNIMEPLLEDPDIVPRQEDILTSRDYFTALLQVRKSSPLFRLENLEMVQTHLQFYNTGTDQIPGLIVMGLEDPEGQIDVQRARIITLFNALPEAVDFSSIDLVGLNLAIHPDLLLSGDPELNNASYEPSTGTFHIPARTAVVFVETRAVDQQIELLLDQIDSNREKGDITTWVARFISKDIQRALSFVKRGKIRIAQWFLHKTLLKVKLLDRLGILTENIAHYLKTHLWAIIQQLHDKTCAR